MTPINTHRMLQVVLFRRAMMVSGPWVFIYISPNHYVELHGFTRLNLIGTSGRNSQDQISYGNRPLQHGYSVHPRGSSVEHGVRHFQHRAPAFTDTPRHRPLKPAATAFVAGSPEHHFATPTDPMIYSQASDTSTVRPQTWQQFITHPGGAASRSMPTEEFRQAIAAIENATRQSQTSQQRLHTLVSQKNQVLSHYKATADEIVRTNDQLRLERAGHRSNGKAVMLALVEEEKELVRHHRWLGNKFKTLEYEIEEAHGDFPLGV